jgi:hypothetical protein
LIKRSKANINDFEVQVASIDVNNRTVVDNPDFFYEITGYITSNTNIGIYTFFEEVQDAINLTRKQLIASSTVAYQYATSSDIAVVKYDYALDQYFMHIMKINST